MESSVFFARDGEPIPAQRIISCRSSRKRHAVCCIGRKKLPLLFRAPAIHLKLRKMRFKITPDFSISTALLQFHIEEVPGLSEAQLRSAPGAVSLRLPPGLNYGLRERQEWLNRCVVEELRRQCRLVLAPRVQAWAKRGGVSFNRLTFKDVSSRWGSCSSLRNVNFNVWLLLLDEPLVDYVVCHELAHLTHLNHSAHFYAEVDRIMGLPGEAVRRDRELNRVSRSLAALGRYR